MFFSKLLHFSPHLAPMMIKVILLTENSCPSRRPMEHPADVRMMASWFRMGQILSVPQTKSMRCEGNIFQHPFRPLLLLSVIISCHIVKAITDFAKVTLPIMHLYSVSFYACINLINLVYKYQLLWSRFHDQKHRGFH